MTRDDIIRMAREAELEEMWDLSPRFVGLLERFADLVAAAENEACAKLCTDLWCELPEPGDARDCYDAIRARREQ